MNLLHVLVRQWRQRPARTLLSLLSVAIAVASVFGIALAQSSVRLGYRKLIRAVEGPPALEIIAGAGGRLALDRLPRLDDLPGLQARWPLVTRGTMARINGQRFRTVLLGVPADDPSIWRALRLTKGRPCRGDDEMLVTDSLADSLKVDLGDRVTVLTRRGPRSAHVVGVVQGASLTDLSPAAWLVMPLAAAQQLFELQGQADRMRLLAASAEDRDRLKSTVAQRLPAELVVQTPVDQMELADSILRSTELALKFAGALTMAMAAFIILNTLRMNFGERRRDVAVLRVLGVTGPQLVRMHLMEGAALGVVGTLAGIPLGLALGAALDAALNQLVPGNAERPEISGWTIPTALAAGPIVACIAALVPALQSRRVSPVEALGDPEVRRGEKFPAWAVLLGLVMWLAAAALLLAVMFEFISPEAAIPSGVLMMVGFLTVLPALLQPIVRLAARGLSRWTGIEGDFAAEQLLERPTRTGLAAGVLVAAVSTSLGMGNAILNNVTDIRQWYRRTMSGDVFLTPAASDNVVVAGELPLADQIRALPAVDRVTELRYLAARVDGIPGGCIIRNFDPRVELPWALDPGEMADVRAALAAGRAVIGNVMAKKVGLEVGDALRLEIQGRNLSVPIGARVRDYTLGGMVVFLDVAAAEKLVTLGEPQMYIVQPRAGTPLPALLQALEPLAREQGLGVRSFADLRRTLDSLIDGIVTSLWGLVAVGFVIGGVAVANTLTMSVLEQTRELGLLRIIGMTRTQVRKMVLCEALLMGILGTLLGAVAGGTTAFVIHLCNEPLLGQSVPFHFHPWLTVTGVTACLLITLLAAWSPGRRAARLNLLSAIAYE